MHTCSNAKYYEVKDIATSIDTLNGAFQVASASAYGSGIPAVVGCSKSINRTSV